MIEDIFGYTSSTPWFDTLADVSVILIVGVVIAASAWLLIDKFVWDRRDRRDAADFIAAMQLARHAQRVDEAARERRRRPFGPQPSTQSTTYHV